MRQATIDHVVRRWASQRTHKATLPVDGIGLVTAFGTDFLAVESPVAAFCGAVLRSGGKPGTVGRLIVVMKPETEVECRTCAVLSRPLLPGELRLLDVTYRRGVSAS